MTLTRRLAEAAVLLVLMLALAVTALGSADAATRPGPDSPVCAAGVPQPCAQGQLDAERTGRQLTAASIGTRAERDAYVRCVAPGSGITLAQRILMLKVAAKALEGITAGVPPSTITAGLARLYPKLTRAELSKAYWCTVRVWGR